MFLSSCLLSAPPQHLVKKQNLFCIIPITIHNSHFGEEKRGVQYILKWNVEGIQWKFWNSLNFAAQVTLFGIVTLQDFLTYSASLGAQKQV